MENKTSENKTIFISYKDDCDQLVTGYFYLIELNQSFVKVKTGQNYITIPFHRVLKIKESV
jgi:uncharacterized protein (UPF0248 family)